MPQGKPLHLLGSDLSHPRDEDCADRPDCLSLWSVPADREKKHLFHLAAVHQSNKASPEFERKHEHEKSIFVFFLFAMKTLSFYLGVHYRNDY